MKKNLIIFLMIFLLQSCSDNENKIHSENELNSISDDFSSDKLNADWNIFNINMADFKVNKGSLVITPTEECVWWMKYSGPMLYKLVSGDFNISAVVRTRKSSDTTKYPDSAYQFGGIIIRDPSSEPENGIENYVFNIIGYRGSKLQIEYKSTANGTSSVRGYDWPSGNAELLIIRRGSAFHLYARELQKKDWQKIKTFFRPDLPETIQAGLIAYSFNYWKGGWDLTAMFDEVKFWRENEKDQINILTYPHLSEEEKNFDQ